MNDRLFEESNEERIARLRRRFETGVERAESAHKKAVETVAAKAEAVETEGEANWLRDAGVGCMQGYLFGPPTVTPDFRAFRHGRPNLAEKPD